MKYSSEVTIREDIADIERLFASEEKEFSTGRAGYEIEKGDGYLTFRFKAKDATALRAVLNSVSKMLMAYEKTKAAVEEFDDE